MEQKLKTNKIFFDLYEEIKDSSMSQELAYMHAECRFARMTQQAFGMPFRKFQNFETFLSAYYRSKS
jgi:hypothetical protein